MASDDRTSYMTGKLLLAMPSIGDQRFDRAVIFVCAHDEEGAMGLVINDTMQGIDFSELVGQLKFESDIKVKFEDMDMPVMSGGPVETARGFLLHSSDFARDDTMKVDGTYGVTGTVDALKDVARGDGPKDLLFILGYSGWDAGQLDAELQQNAWLVVEPDPELIFEGDPQEKWKRAINKLGIDPAMLSSAAGRA
ncbi:MAG: YqgE/AlgH family protein [Alphaproteobacteria bacterium]